MKFKKLSNDKYLLRLEKGEEIVASVLAYCKKENINSGYLSGIGAVSEASLALYNLEEKEYSKKIINGPLEIVKLSGFIALIDNEIKAHLHMAVSNKDMRVFGGHLDSSIVAATCEILIDRFNTEISRYADPEIGLNLLNI